MFNFLKGIYITIFLDDPKWVNFCFKLKNAHTMIYNFVFTFFKFFLKNRGKNRSFLNKST